MNDSGRLTGDGPWRPLPSTKRESVNAHLRSSRASELSSDYACLPLPVELAKHFMSPSHQIPPTRSWRGWTEEQCQEPPGRMAVSETLARMRQSINCHTPRSRRRTKTPGSTNLYSDMALAIRTDSRRPPGVAEKQCARNADVPGEPRTETPAPDHQKHLRGEILAALHAGNGRLRKRKKFDRATPLR